MGLFSRKKRAPGPRDAFAALLDREWDRLATAGTWWTGGERIAIADDARRAVAGDDPSGILPAPLADATRRLAVAPATIGGTDVVRWELDGLDPFAYVETVGIVSRLMALDTAAYGLGLPLRPLPEPRPGVPSREKPAEAAITTGWSPTVGAASALTSLTAVPPEADAMLDLHDVLYVDMEKLGDTQLEVDGLTRPQIELVAARTSCLDDCLCRLLAHTSMLRASVTTDGRDLAPGPIVAGVGDPGVDHGPALIAFVDAVVLRDDAELTDARAALEDAIGASATDRAALVAGTVAMMNRVLDGIGAPVDQGLEDLAAEMGLAVPEHLRAS